MQHHALGEDKTPQINRPAQQSSTGKVLLISALFLVFVAAMGYYANSLVLIASAIHLLADTLSLGIAYFAFHLASKPVSTKHTFGLVRTEVLGALANGAFLIATSIWIIFEAFRDFSIKHQVSAEPVIVLGFAGLVISIISFQLLNRQSGQSLNMRASVIHMAGDALGWALTIVSGFVILLFSFNKADAIGSIFVSMLILATTWGIMKQAVLVLLEASPGALDTLEIATSIQTNPEIIDVHHLHLWNLASDTIALSAHVVMQDGATLHKSQTQVYEIKEMLKQKYGINHATIEIECHECGDDEHNLDGV